MNYGEKAKKQHKYDIWNEFCGFLQLTLSDYMEIQDRLLREQLQLWCNCGIGQRLISGKAPTCMEDFRQRVPLTSYIDYADILLNKRENMLPQKPAIWLETTWEGGKHPIKTAPYTESMLESFQHNLLTVGTISSSDINHRAKLRTGDKTLFGLAPLPYVTGLFPYLLHDELHFNYLPPVEKANKMSFVQRNKEGFKMGLKDGIDVFYGLTSVIQYITENFARSVADSGSGGESKIRKLTKLSPKMLFRYLRAKEVCKNENREILPRDLFKLKSLVCAGTDTDSYKESLKNAWGVTPHEIFAGTELSLIASETLNHSGMVLFPNACFYEFIPESEVLHNISNPDYIPNTLLLNELEDGQNYELVITNLKGGVFARYRIGDMFRCVSKHGDSTTRLPLVKYVDRVPNIIDICSFTRISENSIRDVIELSRLPISNWCAKKEYDENRKPYMHMYVEMETNAVDTAAISQQVLREHLKVYFKYFDTDYDDLEKMLGIDPLKITIIPCGSFLKFEKSMGHKIRRMNPVLHEIRILINQETNFRVIK